MISSFAAEPLIISSFAAGSFQALPQGSIKLCRRVLPSFAAGSFQASFAAGSFQALPQGPSKLCRRVLPSKLCRRVLPSFVAGSFQALPQGPSKLCRRVGYFPAGPRRKPFCRSKPWCLPVEVLKTSGAGLTSMPSAPCSILKPAQG